MSFSFIILPKNSCRNQEILLMLPLNSKISAHSSTRSILKYFYAVSLPSLLQSVPTYSALYARFRRRKSGTYKCAEHGSTRYKLWWYNASRRNPDLYQNYKQRSKICQVLGLYSFETETGHIGGMGHLSERGRESWALSLMLVSVLAIYPVKLPLYCFLCSNYYI